MILASNETQLLQLRLGDRLKYRSILWKVKNYSTYTDDQGYETTEWLLQSRSGKHYYLLREFDPKNSEGLVHWYLAEEILRPIIFEPNSYKNLATRLWHDMQGHKIPYPELQALSRHYYFESQTQGTYEGDRAETSRMTWDYWDAAHQWNLAIEAWVNGELHVYSTKEVKPEEFSNIEKRQLFYFLEGFPIWELLGACSLLIGGFLMLIFG
ncbi:MAG TPA: DUF4178 domain-containing protein [Coleofasciculaceae cyanobacterium]